MKKTLPYLVIADYQARGARKPVKGYVKLQAEFDIPEFAERDVPLVLTAHSEFSRLEVRYLDGKFYRPAIIQETDRDPNRFRLDSSDRAFHQYYANLFHRITEQFNDPDDGVTYAVQSFNTMFLDNRFPKLDDVKIFQPAEGEVSKRTGLVRSCLEDHTILIDGCFWTEVDEPRLYAEIRHDNRSMEIGRVGIGVSTEQLRHGRMWGYNRLYDYKPPVQLMSYRLDRLEEFKDFITETRGVSGLKTEFSTPSNLAILMPDVLSYDDEADSLVRSAQSFRDAFMPELIEASNAAVGFWNDLRNATAEALISPYPDTLDALAQTLDPIEAATDNNRLRSDIAAIKDRWELRPIIASSDIRI